MTTENDDTAQPNWALVGKLFRAHPWHGIPIGINAPEVVNCYIEILATDTVKYEVDKDTGVLRIDRPQRYSNVCPELYGFIPQTYCGEHLARFTRERTHRDNIVGDGDPLDICVLTEKQVAHADVLLRARPIGGLRMLDGNEADDKIIAILEGDPSYGFFQDITQCPKMLVERLKHYFLTYKQAPDAERTMCEITHIYDHEEAREVIQLCRKDYLERYEELAGLLKLLH
jgi:inorganic pyrophosphatase